MGEYDVMQVCRNGHVITEYAVGSPEDREDFCAKCGAASLTACEGCGQQMRGHPTEILWMGTMPRPSFCTRCGQSFPWTQGALDAARDVADLLDGLKPEERAALKGSLDDLVRDTPRTGAAVLRFKSVARKVGAEGAGALREVLIDVVSETAKKALWP